MTRRLHRWGTLAARPDPALAIDDPLALVVQLIDNQYPRGIVSIDAFLSSTDIQGRLVVAHSYISDNTLKALLQTTPTFDFNSPPTSFLPDVQFEQIVAPEASFRWHDPVMIAEPGVPLSVALLLLPTVNPVTDYGYVSLSVHGVRQSLADQESALTNTFGRTRSLDRFPSPNDPTIKSAG